MARWLAGLVVASLVVAGCGGQGSAPQPSRMATAAHTAPVTVGPGRLVDIGGGRSLFLNCVGAGSPTVVLEAGFGGNSDNWSAVQPRLGRRTRTCTYDRAGLGNSVAMPALTTPPMSSRTWRGSSTEPTSRSHTCSSGTPTADCSCADSSNRVSSPPVGDLRFGV